MRIPDPRLLDLLLDRSGKTRGKARAGQIQIGIEKRKGPAFLRELHRGLVGPVAHRFGDAGRHAPGLVGVVLQPQHDERVAQPGEAEADAALRHRFLALRLERPGGDLEHVVQHAHGGLDHAAEFLEVESGFFGERVGNESRQIDRTQAAAAIRRQRLLGAGVRRLDRLAVVEVLSRLMRSRNRMPGSAWSYVERMIWSHSSRARSLRYTPQAVVALVAVVARPGFRLVDQFDGQVILDGGHEVIRHPDREVEIGELAPVLGVDELLDVGVVAAQHAHLGAAARAGGFDRLARLVEHAHVGHRAAGARTRALHLGALRPDGREVVADAAAAAHGLGRLLQRGIDARLPSTTSEIESPTGCTKQLISVAWKPDAGGGVDAPGGDEAFLLRLQEAALPMGAPLLGLGLRQRARHAAAHVIDRGLLLLGVFLEQRIAADFLLGRADLHIHTVL